MANGASQYICHQIDPSYGLQKLIGLAGRLKQSRNAFPAAPAAMNRHSRLSHHGGGDPAQGENPHQCGRICCMLAIVSSGREPFARPLQAALQALVAIARTAPHLEAERAVLRGALVLARFAERPGGVKELDREYRDACRFLAQTGSAEPWANGRIQEVLAALPSSDDDDGLEPALAGGGGPKVNPPMPHEASMEAEATDEEALAAWSVVARRLLSSERATA